MRETLKKVDEKSTKVREELLKKLMSSKLNNEKNKGS